jgi:hypothetical protein
MRYAWFAVVSLYTTPQELPVTTYLVLKARIRNYFIPVSRLCAPLRCLIIKLKVIFHESFSYLSYEALLISLFLADEGSAFVKLRNLM